MDIPYIYIYKRGYKPFTTWDGCTPKQLAETGWFWLILVKGKSSKYPRQEKRQRNAKIGDPEKTIGFST